MTPETIAHRRAMDDRKRGIVREQIGHLHELSLDALAGRVIDAEKNAAKWAEREMAERCPPERAKFRALARVWRHQANAARAEINRRATK